ncbi:TPA: single-stranded-DNA-specific exonuclease RecJ [Candidatus Dependentiae bacterium]|nr:single-stranded-DNA-specific exonuclease RecJ [Candidatus Dependentiae bacterium]
MIRQQGHKYVWSLPSDEKRALIEKLSLSYSLSFPVVQLLVNRGLVDAEAIEQFLFTPASSHVFDPSLMKDACKAVERIERAIRFGEKILIAGDYDVDGISAASLMMRLLLPLGARVNFFLPHRIYDGYGLSVKTIQKAAESGYKVVITVDNGITAFAPAEEAKKRGIDLIITDHHKPHDRVPDAFAVVDPCQADCLYPFKYLAGVGVAFKLMTLLYERASKPMPAESLELLLLGTIADVVPLRGENRYWVRKGLQHVNEVESPAFRALKRNARFSKTLSAMDIGFMLAPQLNALGRLEDSRAGVKFLIGEDEQETDEIGMRLHTLNQARKGIERSVVQDVQEEIASGRIDKNKEFVFMACRATWSPGVIGLAAARIVSEFGRPVFLFHESGDVLKGSCRSIPGINIFNLLQEAKDMILQFGGHAAAAGLSVHKSRFPELKEHLERRLHELLTLDDLKQKIVCDAELTLPETNGKLLQDLAYLEPFGSGNERPYFYLKNVSVLGSPQLLKDEHVRCQIFADGVIKPVIFFGRPDLFDVLSSAGNDPIDLVVNVTENYWEGMRRIEFHGVDVARTVGE